MVTEKTDNDRIAEALVRQLAAEYAHQKVVARSDRGVASIALTVCEAAERLPEPERAAYWLWWENAKRNAVDAAVAKYKRNEGRHENA